MWPVNSENYVLEKLSRISFKIFQYNLNKIRLLDQLAMQFRFQIWETYRNDSLAAGVVVFDTFLEAYTFFRKYAGCSDIQFSNSWFENIRDDIGSNLLKEIKIKLNYDCIERIADYLDVLGMADLITINPHLISIAQRRFANLVINESTVGHKFGVMHFCYTLNSFGEVVENIEVSIRCFRGGCRNQQNFESKYGIIYCMVNFSGPKLRSITMNNFSFSQNEMTKINPLISILRNKNVMINMS